MSLALSTLIYEWRRYLAAVIALAFSGLLILAEVGMFVGIGKSFTATIDRSPADIMVTAPHSESLMNGDSSLPRRIMPLLYLDPEVVQVADMAGSGAAFRNFPRPGQKVKQDYVQLMAVDLQPGAVTWPTDYGPDIRQALSAPFSVVLDESALKQLGVRLGDKAILNGHIVRIRGLLHNYANINRPMLILSRDTLTLLQAPDPERSGALMVRIRDPKRAIEVRDQLNVMGKGSFRAWTRNELARANDSALMKEQVIGVMMNFTIVLGVFIGVGITWQTLRGAILANIKEFASLRALGVSVGSLRRIVLELAFWVGVVGLMATAVFVWGVAALGKAGGVPMSFPASYIIGAVLLLMFIALGSGMLSLGILKKSQPADLLR
ncbi:MAG TPA: ABC transporter permease [Caulobacteraceae bacterium]